MSINYLHVFIKILLIFVISFVILSCPYQDITIGNKLFVVFLVCMIYMLYILFSDCILNVLHNIVRCPEKCDSQQTSCLQKLKEKTEEIVKYKDNYKETSIYDDSQKLNDNDYQKTSNYNDNMQKLYDLENKDKGIKEQILSLFQFGTIPNGTNNESANAESANAESENAEIANAEGEIA